MITLYPCVGARSFRALWALEELGLPHELKLTPLKAHLQRMKARAGYQRALIAESAGEPAL
jgi:glutathione S-transferase